MNEIWRDGNEVELLINGDEFFPRVFDTISHAQREVILETFIFNEDEVGRELQRALMAAAKRGVTVDVTVDDYGSAGFSQSFINTMVEAGIKLHVFDPTPRFLGARVNLFRRLHRKIVVVDNEIAFVGGINYSADHVLSFGPTAKQDYAVQIRGPIVSDIHESCLQLLQPTGNKKRFFNRPGKAQQNITSTPVTNSIGSARMEFVVRDNVKHKNAIEQHYLHAIHKAQHRVVIANAYFFPGFRLLSAIRRAARRGVAVTLILQGRPDMPWVSFCSRLLYGYLLRSGVTIHEYCKRPLHGKVALMDDSWATIGSSNLDPLSLALNLEANVMIESSEFNQKLYEHLQELAVSQCKPVDLEFAKHGYWWRLPLIFLSFHFLRHFPSMVGWLPMHSPEVELLKVVNETHSENLTATDTGDILLNINNHQDKDIKQKNYGKEQQHKEKQPDTEEAC